MSDRPIHGLDETGRPERLPITVSEDCLSRRNGFVSLPLASLGLEPIRNRLANLGSIEGFRIFNRIGRYNHDRGPLPRFLAARWRSPLFLVPLFLCFLVSFFFCAPLLYHLLPICCISRCINRCISRCISRCITPIFLGSENPLIANRYD